MTVSKLCCFDAVVFVVGLDKFTTCTSTVRYSGRRAVSAAQREESGGRRAASEVEGCDFFSGEWVLDNSSYPLYNESLCPYMSDQLACHKHGRLDLGYQFWRWQPQNCDLKRWVVLFLLLNLMRVLCYV